MNFSIEWDISEAEYTGLFNQVRFSNLLQSPEYGRVCARINYQKVRRGRIVSDGSVTAGIFQMLEAGIIRNAIHGIILDRAPLWMDGFGSAEDNEEFFRKFARVFPKRPGRARRVIPETEDKVVFDKYKRLGRPGYSTVWVDLTLPEDELRASMRGNWRGHLNKSEKFPLEMQVDNSGNLWPELRNMYIIDREVRCYPGPSVAMLDALIGEFLKSDGVVLCKNSLFGKYCSGMLLFKHGRSATWQIGQTPKEGRISRAGYNLLWKVMLELKRTGTETFDLGGVNKEGAAGVRLFKIGTGGRETCSVGHFV